MMQCIKQNLQVLVIAYRVADFIRITDQGNEVDASFDTKNKSCSEVVKFKSLYIRFIAYSIVVFSEVTTFLGGRYSFRTSNSFKSGGQLYLIILRRFKMYSLAPCCVSP